MHSRPDTRKREAKSALPFPTAVPPDGQSSDSGFFWARSGPPAPENLHFEIAIPGNWDSSIQAEEHERGLAVIMRFVRRSDQRAGIQVSLGILAREIGVFDLLRIGWESAGGQIIQQWEVETATKKYADCLIRLGAARGPQIWRSTMRQDGSRYFRVEGFAEESVYAEVADEIFVSLASFRLLHPEGTPAEPLSRVRFNGSVPFSFDQPSSWRNSGIENRARSSFVELTLDQRDDSTSRIGIEVFPRDAVTSPLQIARATTARFEKLGLELEGATLVPIDGIGDYEACYLYHPAARDGSYEKYAPVLLLKHATAWIALSLISPSRSESPEWWGISKRAFEIVRDSLALGEERERPNQWPGADSSASMHRKRMPNAGSY